MDATGAVTFLPVPERMPVRHWPVPVALGVGFFLAFFSAPRFLISSALRMQLHELGHATMLWLGSRPAIPLPMFTVSFSEGRSLFAFLLVAGFLAYAALRCWSEDCRPVAYFLAALLALQLLITAFVSVPTLRLWVAFAGCAGELVWGALLTVGYYHQLPHSTRWRQVRGFFLTVGALSFAVACNRWIAAVSDPGEIPWGSFFGGDGDMENLRGMTGWTSRQIVRAYLWTAALGAAVIAAHWVWFWTRRTEGFHDQAVESRAV
jgi:hypothetical protein